MESNPTVAAVMLTERSIGAMQPKVIAIMLTSVNRATLTDRAIRSFEAQSYDNKKLVLYRGSASLTVGTLRNAAIQMASGDIVVHFDDDDWSHPDRIAEQVALLQSSGADCVGYREMLFWNETRLPFTTPWNIFVPGYREKLFWDDTRLFWTDPHPKIDEAWLYTNPEPDFCLGTSLCYWRHVWERKPFEALPVAPGGTGEDWKFQQGLKRTAVSSLVSPSSGSPAEPRMIASIHGGNTSDYSIIDNPQQRSFKRAPEWEEHCRKAMEG
jgi:hypothetical protein